jgi:hypothetical protein
MNDSEYYDSRVAFYNPSLKRKLCAAYWPKVQLFHPRKVFANASHILLGHAIKQKGRPVGPSFPSRFE